MTQTLVNSIADFLRISEHSVKTVTELLNEGATIPFIARYRKEATGSLDEVAVAAIRDQLKRLEELESRRESILKSLEKNGHLTEELKQNILAAKAMAELEDLYLPYKPKRRTKAAIAREKGLEPFADIIFSQGPEDPWEKAREFVDPEKDVEDIYAAVAGAKDIIAEAINENAKARAALRDIYMDKSTIQSEVVPEMEKEGEKFRDYFLWEEKAATAPSHRILAMRRGEKEDVLNLSIKPPVQEILEYLNNLFVKGDSPCAPLVAEAVEDSFKRLLSRAMETEIRVLLKEKADREAIAVFSENLRELLLAPPLGDRRVMGVDPGFRTGCKIVCLDRQGKLLHNDTIFPHTESGKPDNQKEAEKIRNLVKRFEIEAVAIGNGTAGRETESFFRSIPFDRDIPVVMVNESGASVYSASEAGREEFPDQDLTVRGAVSIGRRLMDPLAELVKIDPKSIGVGQYQHDVDQSELKQALDDTVESCVNMVGVDVNRASSRLLTYVSGLGPRLAGNIVSHRDNNGPFTSRESLKNVSRLGPKAFEQAAGFLRIPRADNPLDASAVHPESYPVVEKMADDLGCSVSDLIKNPRLRKKIDPNRYITDSIGLPTLTDILQELDKPGRDPRKSFEVFRFHESVRTMEDLKPGMKLPGIVTNVTAFGAFVDVGVHQDGLVHVSQLSDRFVKNPADFVKVHQQVVVTILDVDIPRKRISMSMKSQTDDLDQKPKKSSPKKKEKKPEKQNKPFHNPFGDIFGKDGK